MELASVRQGDIVECDIKGRRFFALVREDPAAQRVPIRPINVGVTYRTAKAVEVIGHYKRSKRSVRAREEAL